MILRKALLRPQVKRQHAGGAVASAQRHGKRGLQDGDLRAVSKIFCFRGGVPVDNRLLRLRYPAAYALPKRDLDRSEEIVVHSVYIFGDEFPFFVDIEND